MKVQKCLGITGVILLVSLVMAGIGLAAVPGTINYQGVLTDNAGVPLDGTYDMAFGIYDQENFGSLEWSESHTSITVTNGVYNVLLGTTNALDSSVFNGSDRWLEVTVEGETMSPRQPITATAYAFKAADADALSTNTIADLDARYVLEGESGAVNSDMIADGAVGTSEIIDGQVTTSDLADGTSIAEILDDDGSGSGLDADLLDGHSSSYFMAAGTDNWVNQTGDTMSGALNIDTTSGTNLDLDASASTGTLFGLNVNADHTSTGSYYTYGLYSDTDSTATGYTYGTYTNAVGAGATYGLYSYGRSSAGTTYGIYNYASPATGNNASTYGIRTSAYASGTGSLWGGRNYASHSGTAGTTYGLETYSYGSDEGTAYGIKATAANAATNYAGHFTTTVDDGIPVVGLQSSGYTVSDLSYWEPGGLFGGRNGVIGFTEVEYGYGVVGEARADSTRGVYGVAYGDSSYGGYFYGSGTSAIGVYAYGTLYAADFNGNVRIRNGSTTVMELGAGLDYAEGFDVSEIKKPAPGSVLIIDPENPGKLTLSNTAYDTKVAGIVAGANNLGSGVRLGGDQFDNDVALAGRVYCNADATQSAIRTGDLLTTSDLPGYAMKADDYSRAQGAIIGKAMQDMAQGEKGKILVLVTLQ